MRDGYVKAVELAGIGLIEFSHPKGNSLPRTLLAELQSEMETFCKDTHVKVILLKSSGEKTFCAGASFDELLNLKNTEEGIEFFSGFANVINAMRKCPKFVVAKVQGRAVGGGVGLIAASDYVFAHKTASVRLSELSIGIAPFVIAAAVESKIGKAAFMEMTIDTEWKSADWALQKGLYNKVFENIALMEEELRLFLNRLSRYSLSATEEIKKIFWSSAKNWDDLLLKRAELSGKLVLEKEAQSFLAKFKGN
jgi:methylglutaconyl-CoA hydratase